MFERGAFCAVSSRPVVPTACVRACVLPPSSHAHTLTDLLIEPQIHRACVRACFRPLRIHITHTYTLTD